MDSRSLSRLRRSSFGAALVAAGMLFVTLSVATQAVAEGDPTKFSYTNDADSLWSPDACAAHTDQFRFRLYYHPGYQGAWINIGHNIYDLAYLNLGDPGPDPLPFCSETGDGSDEQVANNAASAFNWFDSYCAVVHYSAGFQGASQTFSPGSGGDLNPALRNNDRSVGFGACW